jgi:hypothetical protein
MSLLAFLLKQPGEYINALDGKVEKKKWKSKGVKAQLENKDEDGTKTQKNHH